MADDIVARLRIVGIAPGWDREDDADVIDAAADEIERLRAALTHANDTIRWLEHNQHQP